MVRSWSDRYAIVARSPHDQGYPIAKSRPIHPGFEATTPLNANRSHDASIPPPWPLQLPMILRPISPLKTHVVLHCSSTFDWFVKKLSEFWGRSLFHRDPPTFDSISKQLERDWSRISPWFHRIFPLNSDVREEESEQIRFNPRELKPHSCGNRVSSEIQSIIIR